MMIAEYFRFVSKLAGLNKVPTTVIVLFGNDTF